MTKKLTFIAFSAESADDSFYGQGDHQTPINSQVSDSSLSQPQQREKWQQSKFTECEDAALQCLLESNRNNAKGRINWNQVAFQFNNQFKDQQPRKASQLYQRWNRVLKPTIIKGYWTREEDEQLIRILSQIKNVSYSNLSSLMGQRSDIQIRHRIKVHIDEWISEGLVKKEIAWQVK